MAQPDTTDIKKLKYTNVKFYLGQKKVLKDVLLYDAWAMGKLDIYPAVADSLAKFLLLRKNIVIELGGHSNCANAKEPGTNAAKAVKDYLLTKGVPADRIQTHGYGNALPLVKCPEAGEPTSDTYANRRVEAKIVDFVKPNFTYQDSVFYSGQVMVFNGLYNHHPIDFDTLSNLANFLNKWPKLKIEIGAHSDSRGTKQEKLDRSTDVAMIVKKDLIGFGVNETRITTVGYGDAYILNDCRGTTKCTEEEHQVNRRVEFKILSTE
jgi:outer membrane protein OmpA-like peptidoglycan-associated protein